MIVDCYLGYSDHEMVEFKIFIVMRKKAELLPWISRKQSELSSAQVPSMPLLKFLHVSVGGK